MGTFLKILMVENKQTRRFSAWKYWKTIFSWGRRRCNGRKVGVGGKLNGQVNGNIGFNRRTGITAQVGGKGQAHIGAQIGGVGVQANLRVNVGIGRKNGHFGVNGGIHGGIDIKTGNGKSVHIGKQTIKNGANFIRREVNSFGNNLVKNIGSRTFGGIVKNHLRRN